MNKMIKVATIVAGVGAMLSFAGCGAESSLPEEQYGKLAKEYALAGCSRNPEFKAMSQSEKDKVVDKEVAGDLEKFRKMTPEQQQAAIKEMKEMINMMK